MLPTQLSIAKRCDNAELVTIFTRLRLWGCRAAPYGDNSGVFCVSRAMRFGCRLHGQVIE